MQKYKLVRKIGTHTYLCTVKNVCNLVLSYLPVYTDRGIGNSVQGKVANLSSGCPNTYSV